MTKQSVARPCSPVERADDAGSAVASRCTPGEGIDWLELCRKEFLKTYFQQTSGDEYELSPNVYGDEP